MMYLKGIEAGADIVDTSLTPFAMGTSQPATESLVMTLRDTPYDTGLDMDVLIELGRHFKKVRDRFLKEGLINPLVMGVDIEALWYQIPGGMLSNLVSQLTLQGNLEKLPEVMQEIPKVRKDLGYPPLVTPTSQLVGAQALINVMADERYKMIPREVKDYVRGMYGRSPAPMDPQVVEKVLGNEKPIEGRPADHLAPKMEEYKKEIEEYYQQEEDVLSYALFPAVAKTFFEYRREHEDRD